MARILIARQSQQAVRPGRNNGPIQIWAPSGLTKSQPTILFGLVAYFGPKK